MGTTPNFSWPYPESSDYVADGATAIENLADAIDTTLAPRASGRVGYAEKYGTPIHSNIISIQDISGLSMTVTVDTSKIYLFVLEGFAINSTSGNVWCNTYVRDSGVSLLSAKTFVQTAYGNQTLLVAPYKFSVGGAHTIVASIARTGGGGQLDIYGTSFPWTFSMYELGDY